MIHPNFGYYFESAKEKNRTSIAVVNGLKRITYQQLSDRTNQVAHMVKEFGVTKGDRVGILLSNDYRFIEIVYGIMRAGGVPVPINIKLPKETINFILKDCEAKLVFSCEKLLHLIKPSSPKIISVSDRLKQPNSYDALLEEQPTDVFVEVVSKDDLCFLLYTSGSTGRPKGCMLTHKGQYWNAQAISQVRELDHSEKLLIFAPLYHANAIVNVQSTLLSGGTVVILPKVDEEMIFKTIEKEKITFMTGVPAIYKMLINYYKKHPDYELGSLRFLMCGSSELAPETFELLKNLFKVQVLESYGLSEGGPVVFSSTRKGDVMAPLPGVSVKIVDNQIELNSGEIGELYVNSPGIAKGYWNMEELTKERFNDGWLKTGDLAMLNSSGHAYIVGRKDDMISVGGENTYPKEIENVLLKHSDVQDVRVLAIPDELKGQVPIAAVVKTVGSNVKAKDIQDFFFNNGPVYAYPRHVLFFDQLPLTGTGKVDMPLLSRWTKEKITERQKIDECST